MNNDVQKIKRNIIKECCEHLECEDCPYNDGGACSVITVFNNQDVPFTPETTFLELFKKAITKECEVAEECKLCRKYTTCQYRKIIPSAWDVLE